MSEQIEVRRSYRLKDKPVQNYSYEKFLKAAIYTCSMPAKQPKKKSEKCTAEQNRKYDDIFSSVVANAFMMDVNKTPDQYYAAKRKREAQVDADRQEEEYYGRKCVEKNGSMDSESHVDESSPSEDDDVPEIASKKRKFMGSIETKTRKEVVLEEEDSSDDVLVLEMVRCTCGKVFDTHIECHKHIFLEHDDTEMNIACECSKRLCDIQAAHACHICGVFAGKLEEHIASHYRTCLSKTAVMECRFCVKQFFTVREVVNHEQEKHMKKKFTPNHLHKCQECSYTCSNSDLLCSHYSTHLDSQLLLSKIAELQDKIQAQKEECPFCRVSVSTRKTFRSHILKQHYPACKSLTSYHSPINSQSTLPLLSDAEVKKEVNEIAELAAAESSSSISLLNVKKEVKEEVHDDGYPAF